MSFRFQADADLNPEIGRGLRRREPSVDFRAAVGVIADGTPDPEVLQIAAGDGRVLVSRDITTMPDHFARFVAHQESPGILLDPFSQADWLCKWDEEHSGVDGVEIVDYH